MTERLPIETEFLFRLSLEVAAPETVGTAADHELRVIAIKGVRARWAASLRLAAILVVFFI